MYDSALEMLFIRSTRSLTTAASSVRATPTIRRVSNPDGVVSVIDAPAPSTTSERIVDIRLAYEVVVYRVRTGPARTCANVRTSSIIPAVIPVESFAGTVTLVSAIEPSGIDGATGEDAFRGTRRSPRLGDGGLVYRESAPPWGGLGGYPITPRVLNVPLA
ncbi:hypothetical protein BH23ACT5_BH23ACT5_11950 [soil metagenome]